MKFLTSNESKDTNYCSSISVEWFPPPRNFQDYAVNPWGTNQVRWDWYLADFSCTMFTCSNVLVSFLQFPCHCIWSIVQIILFVVISCIFIFFLLIEKKKKKKISRIILYIESRLKLHKICKRSIIMYRNWDSYFVFLLLNCIKKVRANSIPKNYHRNAWCVCRVCHLLIL